MKMPDKIRPTRGFAIVDPTGTIAPGSVRTNMADSKNTVTVGRLGTWQRMYAQGWRCIKVAVIPTSLHHIMNVKKGLLK